MKRFVLITVAAWTLLGSVAIAQPYTESEGSLGVNSNTVAAGDVLEVEGTGFAPGSEVEIVLTFDVPDEAAATIVTDEGESFDVDMVLTAATEVTLATVTTDDDGSFTTDVTIPDEFTGDGVLFARGIGPDGATRVLGIRISAGQVEELAFTGTSSRTGPMVIFAVGLVLAGSAALLVGRRVRTS